MLPHTHETDLDAATTLRRALSVGIASALMLVAGSASAGIHTWDVVEVFSDASGQIQYVELLDTGTGGTETGVGNGSLSSSLHSISWSNGPVTPPTNGKSYLIATADFAALAGAPVPDVIIPAANVPFFDTAGDTVAFGGFDTFVFGAVPTNGVDSLDKSTGVGTNTPKNYAGVQGSVVVGGSAVPSLSAPMVGVALLVLFATGVGMLRGNRAEAG